MNTKRHRCSRANIICCNYDNTRLIQDVGIRVGWDAFHQYSNNQRILKKREKIAGSCQTFSQLSAYDNWIFPFVTWKKEEKKKEEAITWLFLLQSQPPICNLSSSYRLQHNISYNSTEWPYSSMQLRSLRRTFSGTQLKFWIGLILHMLHYKMACIHSLFRVMTTWLHPKK